MKNKYSFNWSTPIVTTEGNELVIDALGRAKYASFITNYLIESASHNGYVINLNAPWGAGKSYFLQRWMHDLKDKHPVVYIDAWKQDFSNDPMLSVISSISEQLGLLLPPDNRMLDNFGSQASKFFKAAAPAITKGIIKKISGINIDDISDATTDSKEETGNWLDGSASSDIAKVLIAEHNSKLTSVKHLKSELFKLVEAINGLNKDLSCPTFIFIDELDRCRPTYAVEMLEVIKHFFNVKNVVFVVATDTKQLQHAIKVIYGSEFDAERYLSRFFNRRFTLNKTKKSAFVGNIINKTFLEMKTQDFRGFPTLIDNYCKSKVMSEISDAFNLSLRDTEQLMAKIQSVLMNQTKGLNLYILAILFILYEKDYDLYNAILSKHSNISNLDSHLNRLGDNILSYEFYFSCISIGQNETIIPSIKRDSMPIDKPTYITVKDLILHFNNFLHLELNERHDVTMEIKRKMMNTSTVLNDLSKNKYNLFAQIQMIKILTNAEEYNNWVELAVSFDE